MAKAAKKKSTTKRTTTAKTAATKSTARTTAVPKPATKPKTYAVASTKPAPVENAEVTVANIVKRKEFMDRVIEKSGMKPKDVKPVVEATLAVLGDAIQQGEEVAVRPLGRMKVNRQKDNMNALISILKLRQPKAQKAAE